MQLSSIPIFDRLASKQRILIAGAGGGFDIFAGIPLFLTLLSQGKTVQLANFSFTDLEECNASMTGNHCWKVEAHTKGPWYFPEQVLASWLKKRGIPQTVYAFGRSGVQPLLHSYEMLQSSQRFDAVVLVDGGTDSLMFGPEFGLGTPTEDMTSISAVSQLNGPEKFLVCLGFGVDRYHGVCHAQFLENVAEMTRAGAYLGAFSVLPGMPEGEAFIDLVRYSNLLSSQRPSIVSNSIANAIEGKYGNHHGTSRTKGTELWINPLMQLYFCFELMPLAKRIVYLDQIKESQTLEEVHSTIEAYRKTIPARPFQVIPA